MREKRYAIVENKENKEHMNEYNGSTRTKGKNKK